MNKNERVKATQQLERLLSSGNLANASEDEIVRYIEENQNQLDELPTELLVQLAEKLKSKRDLQHGAANPAGLQAQPVQDSTQRNTSNMSPNNVTV